MQTRRFITLLAVATALLPAVSSAAYPEQPIKVLVPFVPGGTVDNIARQLGERINRNLKGANFLVDNRPGASGTIAGSTVARAAPDGYTLFMGTSSTLGISVFTQKNLPYSPTQDFTPIAMLANASIGVYVNPDRIKARSLEELLALIRSSGKQMSFGSPGHGTAQHLAAELLWARAGVKLTHVAYKGSPPSITDLVSGHIDVVVAGIAAAAPFLKNGKLTMVAVAGSKRATMYPEVPAVAETLKGYDAPAWVGLVGPKGMAPATVAILEQEVQRFTQDPAARASLAEQGIDIDFAGSSAFGRRIAQDMTLWEEAVKASGLQTP